MDKIRVLVKEPEKPAEVREIDNTLEAVQAIVGGHIETLRISDSVFCYLNDEGKLINLAPNFVITNGRKVCDIVCGPAVFFRSDGEGNEISLTLTDIIACNMFTRRYDVANFILNGKPLTNLREG
mgnify:FL=1